MLAGMDVYQLYYEKKSLVDRLHRLYEDPMSIRFWDILLGVILSGWLESNHFQIWVRLLLERCPPGARWTAFPDVFFEFMDNTDWTIRVSGLSDIRERGKPWWEVDRVFFPINVNNGHWVLGELLLPSFDFYLYDTAVSMQTYESLKANKKFERFGVELEKIVNDIDYWRRVGLQPRLVRLKTHKVKNVPQQSGPLGDCGVFVLMFIERLVSGYTIDLDEDAQEAAFKFRARMCAIYWGSRDRAILM